jgi:DNA-binding NarL/FixJ family response regulator
MLSGARSATGVARLLIIDDHEIARAGMRTMLATEPGSPSAAAWSRIWC